MARSTSAKNSIGRTNRSASGTAVKRAGTRSAVAALRTEQKTGGVRRGAAQGAAARTGAGIMASAALQRGGISFYADGNTVRKAEAVPARKAPKRRESEQREQVKRHVRRAQGAQKRAAQADLSIDLPSLFMLTVAVIATLFICFNYLRLTASIDSRMTTIEGLETELENLKTENDALEQSIDTSVDLNYVYSVAVNELGMIHAGKDNIINYDKTESEYVRQYEDIPKS